MKNQANKHIKGQIKDSARIQTKSKPEDQAGSRAEDRADEQVKGHAKGITKTKEAILEKSLELFATKGYFNTTMDDISKAVKIKKASLYFHYPGKDDIFLAVFNGILEEYSTFLDELTRCDDAADTFEKLCGLFKLYVVNCKDNMKMEFWDRYYYYPPERFREQIHKKTYEIEMGFIRKIKELVDAGIRKKELKNLDAQSAAASFYYMMAGLALGVKFYTGENIEREISKCLDIFRTALKA